MSDYFLSQQQITCRLERLMRELLGLDVSVKSIGSFISNDSDKFLCAHNFIALGGKLFSPGSVFSRLLMDMTVSHRTILRQVLSLEEGESDSEGLQFHYSTLNPRLHMFLECVLQLESGVEGESSLYCAIPRSVCREGEFSRSASCYLRRTVKCSLGYDPANKKNYFSLPWGNIFSITVEHRESDEHSEKNMHNQDREVFLPFDFQSCTLELSLEDALKVQPGTLIDLGDISELAGVLKVAGEKFATSKLCNLDGRLVLVVQQLVQSDHCRQGAVVTTELETATT